MKNKLAIILLLLLSAFAFASDRVAPTNSFSLAQVMPKGALVYIQSKDLASQLNTWYKSTTHKLYFESDNYKNFSSSRLFLKFQERVQEFEGATGITLTESDFASAVGGQSALALYNIGELEFVFTTDLPQAQIASSILAQKGDKLQTRKYAGATYYLKTLKSESGSEGRIFAIALVGSRAIVATNESLMQRALKNNAETKSQDCLIDTVLETAKQAENFTDHDVTLWLDQATLNKDRYFKNYWIHNNLKELTPVSKVLIDLELANDRFIERRWLFNSEVTISNTKSNLSDLLAFIPTTAQLVSVNPADENYINVNKALEAVIFGSKREIPAPTAGYNPDTTEYSNNNGDNSEENPTNSPYQRYVSLDRRFDQDIDSPELSTNQTKVVEDSKFLANLSEVLGAAKPVRIAVFAEPSVEANSSFVNFNRAVVVELSEGTRLSGEKLEKIISDELQQRFVVKGNNVKFNWQTSTDNSRSLSRVLIEHGGAYLLEKNFLIFASSADYLAKFSTPGKINNSELKQFANNSKLNKFALVRIRGSKTPFDKLMRRLDGLGLSNTPVKQNNTGSDEESNEETNNNQSSSTLLFSQNLSSLIGVAKDINNITLEQTTGNGVIKEQINYQFSVSKANTTKVK